MRRWLVRTLITLVALLSGTGIALLGTLLFGRVSGVEFAPQTFQSRLYTYYELPVVRVQVTPVSRTVEQSPLAQFLAREGYLADSKPPDRWDFVVARRMGEVWRKGDALILTRYLEASRSDGEPYWLRWTRDHTAMAKVLWPAIARLAQQELYFLTPDIFALAAAQSDLQAFESDLKRLLARKYEELAQVQLELSSYPAAIRFFTETLVYEPGRESSRRGLAQARAMMERTAANEP